MCVFVQAQVLQDPVSDIASSGRATGTYYPGREYYKWVVDINHDGLNDVLLSLKERSDEIGERKTDGGEAFNQDEHTFGVYMGLKDGGYFKVKRVDEPGGVRQFGITIDISQCYIGYIIEVKRYGLVTVETVEVTAPSGKGLPVPKDQIYCYAMEDNYIIKRTNLTSLLDDAKKSPIYDEYLSKSKRTKVQLQEVTP